MMLHKIAVAVSSLLLVTGAASAQGAKPNDAQIAHIAYTAGVADIANAKQALKISKSKEVRTFAQDMERDHKAVNDKALALVKKLKSRRKTTTPARHRQGAGGQTCQARQAQGRRFDKAYIENEVAYHKTVNGALQNTLIPSASNAELKSLLETGLKIFQGHQEHAEHVAAELK